MTKCYPVDAYLVSHCRDNSTRPCDKYRACTLIGTLPGLPYHAWLASPPVWPPERLLFAPVAALQTHLLS